MAEFFETLLMAVFAFGAGFLFGKNYGEENKEEKTEVPSPEIFRTNGSEKPSIAQQMINIMNYNGENQREEDYD